MIEKREGKRKTTYRARVGRSDPWHSFDTKKEAEEYDANARLAHQRAQAGLEVEKGPLSFAALCELYESNFGPGEWRKQMLKRPRERWGKLLVRSIQPEAVGKWLHDLDLSPKTKSHILETMRVVFAAGVEWGYLDKSPVRPGAFKAPGESRLTPIQPFESWAAVTKVADVCDTIDGTGALVRLVASTGLTSPSEWVNARWRDVNLNDRTLVVHGTKTANRQRTIPLSLTAIEALAKLPTPLRQDQLVFQKKTGGPFDYYNWRKLTWPLALTMAGEPKRTPNQLRHTFAVLALQSGVPIDAVADLLGHSDVSITYRYYRKWTKPMAHAARNLLDTWAEEGEESEEATEGR